MFIAVVSMSAPMLFQMGSLPMVDPFSDTTAHRDLYPPPVMLNDEGECSSVSVVMGVQLRHSGWGPSRSTPIALYWAQVIKYPTTTNNHQIIELVADPTPQGPYGLNYIHRLMSHRIQQSLYVRWVRWGIGRKVAFSPRGPQ